MRIGRYLRRDLVFVLDEGISRDALFEHLCRAVEKHLPGLDRDTLMKRLNEREAQTPTSTPEGVAFPHALSPDIEETFVLVAYVPGGVDFGVSGHPPSDVIFCMFGSSRDPWGHVRILARLARLMHTSEAQARLREAQSAEDLYERLMEEDRAHA